MSVINFKPMTLMEIRHLYPESMFFPDTQFDSAIMGITFDKRVVYSLFEMYAIINQDIKENQEEYNIENSDVEIRTISLATLKIYITNLERLLINEDFPPIICEDIELLSFAIAYRD